MEQATELRGKVVWFNPDKGYGFIRSGQQQFFVHFRDVLGKGYKTLERNQPVIFDAGEGERGPKALNVRPL